jgi:hypothetical protein
MPDYNSMQANLGLLPNVGQPTMMMPIKSPAQMAAELSAQATANLQYASSIGPQVARNMPQMMSFGQQFQQQFQAAQQIQSFNPYMANMMGSAGGYGGGQMNLPSPIMMTPASSGVFRPPMPSMGMQAIPPMPVMPLIQTPFTPQLPRPQFQTAWEQELQQRDYRADSIYSYAIQAPRMGGNMAGYGMGAMAGAMMGGRMGRPIIGAAMGMLGAGMSGLAGGMGDLAMMPFRPSMEAHQMGASIQRASQDWVVGGSQLHATGRGLTRTASMDLSRGIMDMQEDRTFRQQTGGMFSRQDLSNILQTGGRAGLMDFTQNTDQIKEQLRRTAISLKKFMELTNDPDVSGLIRKMADLQRLGYGPGDMEGAAMGMRRFSRGAGTSIDGIMQMGGAGAMTYQGMGLSAASGMNYGMFSAMAARQSIASGVYSPAQAAMLGGQSGIAQRNMQAQAAMMSMPLVGASMASFQGGSWGVDYGQAAQRMSGRGGAAGFVTGAAQNLSRAVYGGGGVGALAMYPLQAGMMQDEISRAMSPEQQTAMRFQSALATGKSLGMTGAGAFATGARMMFGDEVATQMLKEASSPQYWKSLKDSVRRQQNELAVQQFQDIKDNAPGFFGQVREELGAAGRSISRTIDVGATRGIERFFKRWGDEDRQEAARESGQYYYAENEFSGMTKQERDVYNLKLKTMGDKARPEMRGEGYTYRNYTKALQYLSREDKGTRSWGEVGITSFDTVQSMLGAGVASAQSNKNIQEVIRQAQESKRAEGAALSTSGVVQTGQKGLANAKRMGSKLGMSFGEFEQTIQEAGGKVAQLAGAGQKIIGGNELVGTTKVRDIFRRSLSEGARKKFDTLPEKEQLEILQNVTASGKIGADAKQAAGLSESEAFFNEGRAGWESAQSNIERARTKLDVMLNTKMGMSSEESEDVIKWMKGTSESVQYATALGLAGDKGNKQANEAKLTELVTKEMKPGTKKSVIDARVRDLIASRGDPKLSDKTRKALIASRDKLGDTKFRASLDVSNQILVEGQTASAFGAMKDILGDIVGGKGEINVSAITDEKLEAIRSQKGQAGLADALKAYRDASTNVSGVAGSNKKEMEVQRQKILGLIGQGADAKSGAYDALTAPTGEQAQQLAASAESLDKVASSMEKAFKNFTETSTKNFAEGAKALAEHFGKATTEPIGE